MFCGVIVVKKEVTLKYLDTIKKQEGKEFLTSVIAFSAAPTIRGKKPSSLVSLSNSRKCLPFLWNKFGQEVAKDLKLEYYEIRNQQDNVLVLFFRRPMLTWYVNNKKNTPLLKEMGYDEKMSLDEKLEFLKERFEDICPHEVGVFLGMPIEDVMGFIKNKGQNCLLCSYWKVYHRPERAELLFHIYDNARTEIALAIVNKSLKNII